MNNKIIVKMKFGSHLYGTATENSDMDYKGIFMPSKQEIFLNRIPKSFQENTKNNSHSKNTKDDIDSEIYSLHYFLQLAIKGETIAIDMLHCPDNLTIEKNNIWDLIRQNRTKLYSKNLKGFIGYVQRQCAKYSVKGSRLKACEDFIEFLSNFNPNEKMKTLWNLIPEIEHLKKIEDSPNGVKQLMVVGKIIQETVSCGYAIDIVQRYYNEYGERAKQAKENKNIDLKAVSHAVRYCLQIEELVKTGDIIFPLKDSQFLKEIKLGQHNCLNNIFPFLEDLVDKVQLLLDKSDFPKKVDVKFWDEFLYDQVNTHVLQS